MERDAIEKLSAYVMLIFGIVLAVILFGWSDRYDEALVEQTATKPSIMHTYAYLDAERAYSSAEVMSDIVSTDYPFVTIDGTTISDADLELARSGNTAALNVLRNKLTASSYTKSYAISEAGENIGISYSRR